MTLARHARPLDDHGWAATARAEERAHRDVQSEKARLTVAGQSLDVVDCRELLDMLGLTPGMAED